MENTIYERYKEKIEDMDMVSSQMSYLDQAADEDELNKRIPLLLEKIGEYTMSDRVYIFDWETPERKEYHNIFEWCKEGIESQKNRLQSVPVGAMLHWQERFEQGKSIMLRDIEEIKESMPSEYQLLKMQDVRAEIAVPIISGNRLNGFLGLDNPDLNFIDISTRLMQDIGVHLSYIRENKRMRKKEQEQMRKMTEALEEAKRASAAKSNFLSRMSHDIRTLLNGVLGILDLNERHEFDTEFVRKNREKAKIAANYLLSLINDVLEMSKLESGKATLQREIFDIIDLLHEVITVCGMKSQEKRIQIEDDGGVNLEYRKLYGSPLHVRQIFMNLLSNAVKYNCYEGKVKCTSRMTRQEGQNVLYEFTVEDTGAGMDKEFLEHIFEPFKQEDMTVKSSYQGTGLGLAITKNLVDLMQGNIDVESTKGVGSKFVVTIPFEIADVNQNENTANSNEKSSIEGMKILLVEDNELNLEIAQIMLEDAGAIVETARDGVEAIERFKQSKLKEYDAILMDIMMPRMDGLEATRQIRQLDRADAGTIGITAVTANAFIEDMQKTKDAGMNEHLAKPFEIGRMLHVIAKYRCEDRVA